MKCVGMVMIRFRTKYILNRSYLLVITSIPKNGDKFHVAAIWLFYTN